MNNMTVESSALMNERLSLRLSDHKIMTRASIRLVSEDIFHSSYNENHETHNLCHRTIKIQL